MANPQTFWDFVNQMNNDNATDARPRGDQDANANAPPFAQYGWGFPFGQFPPMPHRGRPAGPPAWTSWDGSWGAEHPSPAHRQEQHGSPAPPRPGTPPTPDEEVPEDPPVMPPGDGKRPQSPPPPRHGRPHGHHDHPRGPAPPSDHGHHEHSRGPHPPPDHGHREHPRGPHPPPDHGHREHPRGPHPPPDHGHSHHRHRSPHHRGRGCPGRRGRHGPPPFGGQFGPESFAGFDWNSLPEIASSFLANALNPHGPFTPSNPGRAADGGDDGSFTPEYDLFSTAEAYIIHLSVPGAKKGDIDVSYDTASNAIKVSGLVQRPTEVDEKMINTMIQGTRKIGVFERNICLDKNVKVDSEGLHAKLEDGILRIEVAKMVEEEWTEVKKVNVE